LHRNFQGYTTKAGADVIAAGVSSISGLDHAYAQNYRDLEAYYGAIGKKQLPIMRGITLDDDDVLRRAVISRLLCHCVLRKNEIESEFNIRFDDYFAEELVRMAALQKDGLIEMSGEAITATKLGRIFIRNAGMVFDKYLRKPKTNPVFSKTL
jgi:oxygen-independent coproporphyrinogen-3 oxidase